MLQTIKKDSNRRTNSEGFCFLSLDDYTPEQAMHFLSGIVSFDVCAVFETDAKLKKGYGVYAEPIERTGDFIEDMMRLLNGYTKTFTATEYSINQYSNKNFKLIKYIENVWEQWKPLEKQKELMWNYARTNDISECN